MHNITQRAMVVNGTIQPRPMMYIALTYDHRLIDGREVRPAAQQQLAQPTQSG
jgi:pyruvate/2-oxoglutarate dehydrogenase complex dihydrolipoamide acyltransferase (E2) component